ncbi:MAG TPA: radical SAM protein, partial [Candidatus Methanoperedens sp.]
MQFEKARCLIDELDVDPGVKSDMILAFRRRISVSDIFFFREPFTPISMTGTRCFFKCKHCNTHYLRHMLDGSAGKFQEKARYLAQKGEKGILLSGGSEADGSVPTYLFADSIMELKKSTGLKISAHTGIVDGLKAQVLSGYLDMALVDVTGDDDTIQNVLGLDACVKDYEETLDNLSSAGISLAPHIIVGLHYGRLKGEWKALELVRKFKPEVLVIVVFIPTKGTAMEGIRPPAVGDVIKVI